MKEEDELGASLDGGGKVGRSGCENHAESPKPRQGQQKQEDQLCFVCASLCVRVSARLLVYCAPSRQLGAGESCWCEAMNDRPLPV